MRKCSWLLDRVLSLSILWAKWQGMRYLFLLRYPAAACNQSCGMGESVGIGVPDSLHRVPR